MTTPARTPTTSTPVPVVRLQRTIPAPPHDVFRAWLDPAVLRRWLAPADMLVTRVEVDARVGGAFRVWQSIGDGSDDMGGFDCEIAEIVPDARIVFRWGIVGPARREGPSFDSRLTVTFEAAPQGNATTLTLVHERLEGLHDAMPEVAAQVGFGWAGALEKLSAAMVAAG
jgi:uncharacterized protein YndB with AHSA1/START domain